MNKSSGIFLAIAAIVMSVVIWGNPINRVMMAFLPPAPTPVIEPAATEALSAIELIVDETSLMAHVNALAQPRTTPEQKETARSYMAQQLASQGIETLAQQYENAGGTLGTNLIAELPGSNPAAGSIVLGAHYDTVQGSVGADDNGSGIATLLEAARLFSSVQLPRSLKLVFFDQEELQPAEGTGLLGSLAFTNSPANIESVQGAVILDMIGYTCRTPGCQSYPDRLPLPDVPDTGDFLAVLGLSSHTELIGAFMRSGQTNWPLVLSLPIPEPSLKIFPDLLRSDHAPFWERNIPAVFVTDTANFRNPNYHTENDTPETLDQSFFRGSAQHVVNAIATLLSQE